MWSLIVTAALTAIVYAILRVLKKVSKDKMEKEAEREKEVERERKALKVFDEQCEVIYSHIYEESGESGVSSIKKIVRENESSSSEEGRESIIDYLEYALVTRMADSLIESHGRVIKRKRKQSVFSDEYGVERLDKWIPERGYFVEKVLLPQLEKKCLSDGTYSFKTGNLESYVVSRNPKNIEFWEDYVDRWIEYEKDVEGIYRESDCGDSGLKESGNKEEEELNDDEFLEYLSEAYKDDSFDESMSGLDYERYVARIVEDNGWESVVTPSTGDHGADIIAEHENVRVAIQCKLYSSPVGNKSVQEAYSAKDYYECDFAMVISNADFTIAARQIASSLGVALLHHDDVASLLDELTVREAE